jgi:hypothetical protein
MAPLVWGTLLYPDAAAVVRVPGYQLLTSQVYDKSLYTLATAQDTLSVSKLDAQTLVSAWTLPISFLNSVTPVAFAVSSDALYLAINVNWNKTENLQYLTSNQNPRSGTSHGLIITVSKDFGNVLGMAWAGICLGANAYLTDIAALQTGYVACGFDSCNSGIWLGTQLWERYIPVKGDCTVSSLASTAQSLYLSSVCTGDVAGAIHPQPPALLPVVMRLTTMGDVLWGRILSFATQPTLIMIAAAIVAPLFGLDYICVVIVANSSTATLFDSSGALQWTTSLASSTIRGLSLDPAKGVLFTTSDTLIWLSYDSVLRAKRGFTGGSIRGTAGLLAGLDSLIVAFTSADSMFNSTYSGNGASIVAARLQNPFAQRNCSALCESCFGTSASACFSCTSYQSAPFACGSCDPACTSCFGSARSQCRSCAAGHRLQNSECLLDLNCPNGQYTDQLLGICQKCDSSCGTCSEGGALACLTCALGLIRNDKVCISACPSYRFPVLGQCQDCAQPCVSCDGPLSVNCTACKSGTLLAFGACVSVCPEGSYQQAERCLKCLEGCGSCSSPDNCSYCLDSYSILTGHCFKPCPSSYFSQSNRCLPCLSNCSQCVSPSSCLVCQSGFYWNQTSCLAVPQCPIGAFFNGSSCANCHKNCESCWNANVTSCHSCAAGYFLKGNSCADLMKECDKGAYLTGNNTCMACAHGCNQCKNSTLCTACQSGYLLAANSCNTTCPAGTYTLDSRCEPCASHCLQCQSSSICSKCSPQWFLSNDTCVDVCPLDSTPELGICSPCTFACILCDGEVCSMCLDGFYLQASLCLSCPPKCHTCLQPTICLSCVSDFSLFNSSCVLGCPLGYASVSGECQLCPTACLQCSTPLSCDVCQVSLDQAGRYHLTSGVCDLSAVDCYPGYSLQDNICVADGISALDYLWAAVQFAN